MSPPSIPIFRTEDASLQVVGCIVGFSATVGTRTANSQVSASGCNDTGGVDWTATGGDAGLHITAVYSHLPAAFEIPDSKPPLQHVHQPVPVEPHLLVRLERGAIAR